MDEDGYPTEELLERIKDWSVHDLQGLLDLLQANWNWPDRIKVYRYKGLHLVLSTGGWSGNEALVGALNQSILGMLGFRKHERGGYWEFEWEQSWITAPVKCHTN